MTMPPEIKQALDRLEELNRDPASTAAQINGALDDLGRIARKADPAFGASLDQVAARLRDHPPGQ
jgi:ABC-type transporter Mla subunit MlaD